MDLFIAIFAIALIFTVVLRFVAPAVEIGAQGRPLEKLTNAELKAATLLFAVQLRTFETNASRNQPKPPPITTDNQQDVRNFQKFQTDIVEHSKQTQLAFANNYLVNARLLRATLISRLGSAGMFPPYQGMEQGTFAKHQELLVNNSLDTGRIAGADPVSHIADYLERLSRLLP
jgi:hypothetical protein